MTNQTQNHHNVAPTKAFSLELVKLPMWISMLNLAFGLCLGLGCTKVRVQRTGNPKVQGTVQTQKSLQGEYKTEKTWSHPHIST